MIQLVRDIDDRRIWVTSCSYIVSGHIVRSVNIIPPTNSYSRDVTTRKDIEKCRNILIYLTLQSRKQMQNPSTPDYGSIYRTSYMHAYKQSTIVLRMYFRYPLITPDRHASSPAYLHTSRLMYYPATHAYQLRMQLYPIMYVAAGKVDVAACYAGSTIFSG
jgi:hypothetical protein